MKIHGYFCRYVNVLMTVVQNNDVNFTKKDKKNKKTKNKWINYSWHYYFTKLLIYLWN